MCSSLSGILCGCSVCWLLVSLSSVLVRFCLSGSMFSVVSFIPFTPRISLQCFSFFFFLVSFPVFRPTQVMWTTCLVLALFRLQICWCIMISSFCLLVTLLEKVSLVYGQVPELPSLFSSVSPQCSCPLFVPVSLQLSPLYF